MQTTRGIGNVVRSGVEAVVYQSKAVYKVGEACARTIKLPYDVVSDVFSFAHKGVKVAIAAGLIGAAVIGFQSCQDEAHSYQINNIETIVYEQEKFGR